MIAPKVYYLGGGRGYGMIKDLEHMVKRLDAVEDELIDFSRILGTNWDGGRKKASELAARLAEESGDLRHAVKRLRSLLDKPLTRK